MGSNGDVKVCMLQVHGGKPVVLSDTVQDVGRTEHVELETCLARALVSERRAAGLVGLWRELKSASVTVQVRG